MLNDIDAAVHRLPSIERQLHFMTCVKLRQSFCLQNSTKRNRIVLRLSKCFFSTYKVKPDSLSLSDLWDKFTKCV